MSGYKGTSEETEKVRVKRAERRLKTRLLIQLFRRRAGRLLTSLLILLIVFVGIAGIQHWFVRTKHYRTTRHELGLWAVQVAAEIAYKDKWDLRGYRRASVTAPSWNILTKDGLVIDI